jgi:hypothetical protein
MARVATFAGDPGSALNVANFSSAGRPLTAPIHSAARLARCVRVCLAEWRRGEIELTQSCFVRAIESTPKNAPSNRAVRMFWEEAAELLDNRSPGPNLFEALITPDRAMAALRWAASRGGVGLAALRRETPSLPPFAVGLTSDC